MRCTRGSIYDVDVIGDLRPSSSTYKKCISVKLVSDNYKLIYIPENVAHGFLTLTDNTEVFYQISQFYSPEHAIGIRYDDPYFKID
ncbi:MAG: dTDP-4-dehydrorhamnose 3,5-epimerase family protein [Thermodesulfobacteriota bacterium]